MAKANPCTHGRSWVLPWGWKWCWKCGALYDPSANKWVKPEARRG